LFEAKRPFSGCTVGDRLFRPIWFYDDKVKTASLPRHFRSYYDSLASVFRGVCVCAVFAATTCVAAQTPPPDVRSAPNETTPAISPQSTLQGVPNFGKATPTLYRGGQPNKEGFANLAKLGIDIVVDLRGTRAGERRTVTGLGMKYVPIPWRCFHPHDEVFAQFLTLLRENPGKKVFVHCKVGDDRTGMDIAAYRMAEQGWTAEDAEKEMAVYGVDWFHRTICPGLATYEEHFPARFQASPAFQDLRSDKHHPQQQP
jgi:tyrosine-protein phosphatase SIW14